ncbi:MAG: transferase [Deltaproteobacteria bacterium]|nr:transferase [Deltaproteobacteria bacterium]
MNELERLISRIVDRVNVNLREPAFDVEPYVLGAVPTDQFAKFYAFYGVTDHHPFHFQFCNSSLAGSYFLGKCFVDHSVLYKTDVRGDELKRKGDLFVSHGLKIPLHDDEVIRIKDSWLIKNLVHNNSHDPESPEEFTVRNTVSMHYANIHGAPVEGCFIGPYATVDLTTLRNCIVGAYSYVQTGELVHRHVVAGRIWIRAGDAFEFNYRYPPEVLRKYVSLVPGQKPQGEMIEFVESRKHEFERLFQVFTKETETKVPRNTALSRYTVVKGETEIGENVLVAHRAYLEDAKLGKGANAQENCYIIRSQLEGFNVTAHGGKIIHAHMGKKVFVGFNSFLRGTPENRLKVGEGCIIMPHTIMDLEEPLEIPPNYLVWGYIRNGRDLESHAIAMDELARVHGFVELGSMRFEGSGKECVKALRHRIEHILEENGAFFESDAKKGHAQKNRSINYNIVQPHPEGARKGIYPCMDIRP